MDVLHNLFFFIVAIGILITFHEFGHYWVARKLGVKVLRFSIGFGSPLFSWKRPSEHGDIEFVIAALPLGGYVKMLDERESAVSHEERKYAFNCQPLSYRTAIVAAGPVFNLILAVILYWFIYVSGITVDRPIVDQPEKNSIADHAGFMIKDEIIKVEDHDIMSWNDFRLALIKHGLDKHDIVVTVKDSNNYIVKRVIDLSTLNLLDDDNDVLKKLGLGQWIPEFSTQIGGLVEDGAAKLAGVRENDVIRAINDRPVNNWSEVVETISENKDNELVMVVDREGKNIEFIIKPQSRVINGEEKWLVGITLYVSDEMREKLQTTIRYGLFGAISEAAVKTWDMSLLTLRVLARMVTGEASLSNISGPLTIASYAGVTAKIGLNNYIAFLAIISVSLAVLNLLPIPMLDGGHLFYYLIEYLKGSPVSEKFEMYGQQVGMLILAALMAVAFYNDFQRYL